MKIAILGTGTVGDTIGSKLSELGHHVMMGSRSKGNEKARAFVLKNKNAGEGTFAEAASFGEMIFVCTKGEHTLEALKMAGSGLNGKILVDVTNPLDFSKGMPPVLIPSLSNSNSLGEEIQKQFPQSRVVKTFNTMWCGLMVNPNMIAGGDHVNFICGNDAEAKTTVKNLLHGFGWKSENLLDLGDISASRGTEGSLLLWLRIMMVKNSGAFNFKISS